MASTRKDDASLVLQFVRFACDSFWHAMRVAVVLLAHVFVAAVVLSAIYVVEAWFHVLWPHQEPMLFDNWPLKYLFHTMDVAVVVNFVVHGTMQVNSAFRSQSSGGGNGHFS
jgi:hypothetical protein